MDDEIAAANHTGRELELMAHGRKPLAMFYADIGALPNELLIPEEQFAPYVARGEFVRGEIDIPCAYHPEWRRDVVVRYVFFALAAEAWRIDAMKLVKATMFKVRQPDEMTQRLESALLGYTEAQIDSLCRRALQTDTCGFCLQTKDARKVILGAEGRICMECVRDIAKGLSARDLS